MFRKIALLTLFVSVFGLLSASAQTETPTKPISVGVANGRAISMPKPAYPAAAMAVKADGAVNVQVLIDEEGNVASAQAVSGHPLLRQAAEQAALAAKFKPTLLSGQPVKVNGVVVYNFMSSDNPASDSARSDEENQNKRFVVDPASAVINTKAVSLPKPAYPAAARAVRAGGAVSVRVTVNEEGDVISAQAVSGHPLLRAASEAASLTAKFKPTLIEGNPVSVSGIIVYNFVPPADEATENSSGNASTDTPETISGGVVNGRAVSLPKPAYPTEAREKQAGGAVSVSVLIDETGKVISANAVSGDPLLREASEKAALEAKFSPTYVKDYAVKVRGVIVYNFIP